MRGLGFMSLGFQGLGFLAYRAVGTPKSKDRNAMASGTEYHCMNDFFLPKKPSYSGPWTFKAYTPCVFPRAEMLLEILIMEIWKFPKIRGPQSRPQNTIVLIMGTPTKVPLILGNPQN